jgi:hypothetical protein
MVCLSYRSDFETGRNFCVAQLPVTVFCINTRMGFGLRFQNYTF